MIYFITLLGLAFGGTALVNTNQVIEVQGHRGARSLRPENTINGFAYAMENKVEVLEMDLSYTKDHQLILSHDEKINPDLCLDPKGNKVTTDIFIHDLTLAEAQKYDCGSLINPRFPNQVPSPKEKMPSFEEVLALINKYEKKQNTLYKLNVEIKVHNDFIKKNSQKMVKQLIAAVKKHKIYDRTTIQSFDIDVVSEARRQDPKVTTAFLIADKLDEILKNLNIKTSSDLIKKYKFNILSPDFRVITKEQVKDFQAQGIQVIPWTANEPKDWKALVTMEVNGIITDNPVALKEFLLKQTN